LTNAGPRKKVVIAYGVGDELKERPAAAYRERLHAMISAANP
jgi:hypothetical protein